MQEVDAKVAEIRALMNDEDEARYEEITYKGKVLRVIQPTLQEKAEIQKHSGLIESVVKGKPNVDLVRQGIAAAVFCTHIQDTQGNWVRFWTMADLAVLQERRAGGIVEKLGQIAQRLMGGGASRTPAMEKAARDILKGAKLGANQKATLTKALSNASGSQPLVEALQGIATTDDDMEVALRTAALEALDLADPEAAAKNESAATSGGATGSPRSGEVAPTTGSAP